MSTWRNAHEEVEDGRPKQVERRPKKKFEVTIAIENATETERDIAAEIATENRCDEVRLEIGRD